MATLTVRNSAYSSTSTSITITFTTDVTPTAVKLTKDGTNWITATTYTSNSATFNVSSWGKGTFTNCRLKVSYVEESSGGDTPGSSLTISNITGGTFTVSNNATITYTTNKAVTKHEFVMNYTGNDNEFSDGTARVTSSGNNHTMTFNAGELSAGTKNGAIRVTDANGNTAKSNFTLIINEATQTPTAYTITKNLSNCSCSNSSTSITSGSSYSARITANSGYTMSSITVTMGGTNITSSVVSGSNISISKVTGNIVITASATQQAAPNPPSTGSALDDWDVWNNTHGNYVAYMADRVGVNGKAIRITATATPTTVRGVNKNYRSGALVTKKAFKYGTFTFKFKLSANDTYLWAMIWTLPDLTQAEDGYVGKNQRPEFDLLETWGSYTNNSVVQTYHTTTPAGESKTNLKQAQTHVDMTKEHTLKLVWTQDNVVKMYCDGVLKLTINEYMTNWQTGKVDYQIWFLNLGLGTYDGKAPNGVGWFEITDYSFEPVYTRDRRKMSYGNGNFSDGTAPSGPLPSSGGGSSIPTPTTYTITNNLTNCTSNNSNTSIAAGSSYSATISANSGYNLSTLTVTMGGTDITSSAVSGNSISISSVTGNIVITASATQASGGIEPSEPIGSLSITSITGGTFNTDWSIPYTTNKPVVAHYYSTWYQGSDSATSWMDRTGNVTDNGNNSYSMAFTYSDFVPGTKSPAIKVVDADGNVAIKTFTLVIE